MIEGLYEAHLPVKDLNISIPFYEKLGLPLAWRNEKIAFVWIEEGKSWLGLWEGREYETPYHPALRHIAFRTSYENMKSSISWLQSLGIQVVSDGNNTSAEPFIRPYQGNASVYFQDPDGNSLEFMCSVVVPDSLQHLHTRLSFGEWEKLLEGQKK